MFDVGPEKAEKARRETTARSAVGKQRGPEGSSGAAPGNIWILTLLDGLKPLFSTSILPHLQCIFEHFYTHL